MDVETISENLDIFVKNEIKIIEENIQDDISIKSNFFETKYIFYGKDYINNVGFRKVWGKKGIYIFLMDCDIDLDYKTVMDFNECASGGKFKKYEAIKLKRGDCLYLGSCTSESLYTRINQHFKISSCNSSLHLQEKKRLILKDKVKIFAFPVKNKNTKYIEIFIKCIERKLHEDLCPKTGSKRV